MQSHYNLLSIHVTYSFGWSRRMTRHHRASIQHTTTRHTPNIQLTPYDPRNLSTVPHNEIKEWREEWRGGIKYCHVVKQLGQCQRGLGLELKRTNLEWNLTLTTKNRFNDREKNTTLSIGIGLARVLNVSRCWRLNFMTTCDLSELGWHDLTDLFVFRELMLREDIQKCNSFN